MKTLPIVFKKISTKNAYLNKSKNLQFFISIEYKRVKN